jgi:hypothetical protein
LGKWRTPLGAGEIKRRSRSIRCDTARSMQGLVEDMTAAMALRRFGTACLA